MTGSVEGQVTLAVLGEKMDNVEKMLQAYCQTQNLVTRDHESRIKSNEMELVRLGQRMGTTTSILGALQILGMAIATWLGLR